MLNVTHHTATVKHHSISSARVIDCSADLTQAKRSAAREFSAEFRDYVITIIAHYDDRAPDIVATKYVGDRRWSDRN